MMRARRGSVANAALVAVLFLCGVAIALTFDRRKEKDFSLALSDNPDRPLVTAALGVEKVADANGKTVDIAIPGEPAIVMVSSVTCSWCKRALGDLNELANGRPLPRLRLLTLEGAADGAPMIARAQLSGVQLIGPINGSAKVSLTFRYQGTPTFLAVDREGRVVQVMPGYPMREVMKQWYSVMVGDSDTP